MSDTTAYCIEQVMVIQAILLNKIYLVGKNGHFQMFRQFLGGFFVLQFLLLYSK